MLPDHTISYKLPVFKRNLIFDSTYRQFMEHATEERANYAISRLLIEFLRTHRGRPKSPAFWTTTYDSRWINGSPDAFHDEYLVEITLTAAQHQYTYVPELVVDPYLTFPQKRTLWGRFKNFLWRWFG